MCGPKDFVATGNIAVLTAPTDSYNTWRAWYALIVFDIVLLAAGIDIAIVSLLVHPIETTFGISDVGFAAISAIPLAIGSAVVFYPAGLLTDVFRRRNIIAAGCVIWTFGALVAARADSGTTLFLARVLAGAGTGMSMPAIFSMLTDAFPRARRAFAVSIYSAGVSVGGGIGLTICGALVEAAQRNGTLRISGMLLLPWQQSFVGVAAVGIIVLALVLTVAEPPRRERSTLTNANLTSSLHLFGQYLQRHGLLWTLLLFGYTLATTSILGIAAWGPTFGMRQYGITGMSPIALLGAFSTGGSLLGSILGGLFVQRGINHGDPRIVPRMLVAVTVISLAFAVFPYMPSWLLAVVCIGVLGMMSTVVWLLLQIAVQETAPNEVRGQLCGLWGFICTIPSIVGPTLVAFLASGVFAKAGGLEPALAVVGVIMSLLAAVSFAFSGRTYERGRREARV